MKVDIQSLLLAHLILLRVATLETTIKLRFWPSPHAGRGIFLLFLQHCFEGFAELVGAAGGFVAAGDAAELGDDVLDLHAAYE